MTTWRKIRIAGIIIFLIQGLLDPFFVDTVPFEDVPLIFNLISIFLPLIFIPLALVFVMSVQSINPFQNKQWTLPDWDSNFLSLRNPLHFFHTFAFFVASNSVGAILASLFFRSSFGIGLAGLSASAGILIGIKLCTKVYKHKFQPVPEPLQQKKNSRAIKWTRICGTLLILCAIIVFIIAGFILRNILTFKNRAIEVSGKVDSIESKQSSNGTVYYPVFVFNDDAGQEHKVRSSLGSNPPRYKIMDEVQVLYDPLSPQDAKLSSFWDLYAMPFILGISGIINLFMGTVFLFVIPAIQDRMSR